MKFAVDVTCILEDQGGSLGISEEAVAGIVRMENIIYAQHKDPLIYLIINNFSTDSQVEWYEFLKKLGFNNVIQCVNWVFCKDQYIAQFLIDYKISVYIRSQDSDKNDDRNVYGYGVDNQVYRTLYFNRGDAVSHDVLSGLKFMKLYTEEIEITDNGGVVDLTDDAIESCVPASTTSCNNTAASTSHEVSSEFLAMSQLFSCYQNKQIESVVGSGKSSGLNTTPSTASNNSNNKGKGGSVESDVKKKNKKPKIMPYIVFEPSICQHPPAQPTNHSSHSDRHYDPICLSSWVEVTSHIWTTMKHHSEYSYQPTDVLDSELSYAVYDTQVFVLSISIPAIGKSTAFRMMSWMFGGVYINQDECGGDNDKFQSKIKYFVGNKFIPFLFIDKCHHKYAILSNSLSSIAEIIKKKRGSNQEPSNPLSHPRHRVICLMFLDIEDVKSHYQLGDCEESVLSHTVLLAKQRLAQRGSNHKTLAFSSTSMMVIYGFRKSFQFPRALTHAGGKYQHVVPLVSAEEAAMLSAVDKDMVVPEGLGFVVYGVVNCNSSPVEVLTQCVDIVKQCV